MSRRTIIRIGRGTERQRASRQKNKKGDGFRQPESLGSEVREVPALVFAQPHVGTGDQSAKQTDVNVPRTEDDADGTNYERYEKDCCDDYDSEALFA